MSQCHRYEKYCVFYTLHFLLNICQVGLTTSMCQVRKQARCFEIKQWQNCYSHVTLQIRQGENQKGPAPVTIRNTLVTRYATLTSIANNKINLSGNLGADFISRLYGKLYLRGLPLCAFVFCVLFLTFLFCEICLTSNLPA